ncbi:hypothetical protein [Kineococcus sp. SYSU DK018]|uniref:hypothetical protein n=1 Tax=Kineococcus sp. SYSU DK018 TaxID=3383139 RepID=UPI003D7D673B
MSAPPPPDHVAIEVAAFLEQRTRETASVARLSAAELAEQAALVARHRSACELGRAVTAENLALTMLLAGDRHSEHPVYDPAWRTWLALGDLTVEVTADTAPESEGRSGG